VLADVQVVATRQDDVPASVGRDTSVQLEQPPFLCRLVRQHTDRTASGLPCALKQRVVVQGDVLLHREVREQAVVAGSDDWTDRRRTELVGSLKTKPGLRRYLRRTPAGLLRVDHAAVKREAHLDGKWLLRTSNTTLSPEDLAAAYKQLLQVERGWRDMKGHLGLRPVFHHREDRIRAHVQLCWLALLLLRVVENATDDTWRNVRNELARMHVVTLSSADGQVAQRTAATAGQKKILAALKLPEPPRFLDFTLPTDS
jgi:hypothetical protein